MTIFKGMNYTKVYSAVLTLLLAVLPCICLAQRYTPTDTWPYLNAEFAPGEVRSFSGDVLRVSDLNVEIGGGSLHYIDNGVIMQAGMSNVFRAVIGSDSYVNIGGRMHRVLADSAYGLVVEDTVVDYDRMARSDIGYGISSSTASVMNSSLIGLGLDAENGVSIINSDLERVRANRSSGIGIPVKSKKYIFANGIRTGATRREIVAAGLSERKALDAFVKKNRIKWDSPESLLEVLEYLATIQN